MKYDNTIHQLGRARAGGLNLSDMLISIENSEETKSREQLRFSYYCSHSKKGESGEKRKIERPLLGKDTLRKECIYLSGTIYHFDVGSLSK